MLFRELYFFDRNGFDVIGKRWTVLHDLLCLFPQLIVGALLLEILLIIHKIHGKSFFFLFVLFQSDERFRGVGFSFHFYLFELVGDFLFFYFFFLHYPPSLQLLFFLSFFHVILNLIVVVLFVLVGCTGLPLLAVVYLGLVAFVFEGGVGKGVQAF